MYPFFIRKTLIEKRRRELLNQFKESLSVLSSFLSAGYSTENAFHAAIPELRNMFGERALIVTEFEAIVNGFNLNKPLEVMLSDFAFRSGLDDITNFAETFNIAKRNGGNLVHIITHTAGIIRDKVQIIEDIKTLNASKIYEQRMMNIIPFVIIIYMNMTSPDFFVSLYTTFLGRVTMTICLFIYFLSIFLANRIMSIEV
ncbi:hypothetical protein UYO_1821 [Lachnospiraceae bacterium JC7]|nr:hypothetical protein UYO_1821 [Lachnospiraceae bacterium JC7]